MKKITKFLTIALSLFCVFGMVTPVYAVDGAFNAITEFNIIDATSKEVIYKVDDESYELEIGKTYRVEGEGVYLTEGFDPYKYFEEQLKNIDGITFLENGGSDGGQNDDGTYGFSFAFEFKCTKQGVNGSLELLEMGTRSVTTPTFVTVNDFEDKTVVSGTELSESFSTEWSNTDGHNWDQELLGSNDGGNTWDYIAGFGSGGSDCGPKYVSTKDSGYQLKLVCTVDDEEVYNNVITITVVDKTATAEITEGTPSTTTTYDEQTIVNTVKESYLTDEQKKAVNNGAFVEVKTTASKIEPTEEDKNLVEVQLNSNNTVAMYLDLKVLASVTKDGEQVGDTVTVSETGTPVKFTIALDDAYINTKDTVERTYQVVRVHNGTVDVLPASFDAENKTITFETDKFSTYAIMYTDTVKASKTPSTSDTTTVGLYGGMAVVSVLAVGLLFFFKKRNA